MNIYGYRACSFQTDEHGRTVAGSNGSNKPISASRAVRYAWSFHCTGKTMEAEDLTFSETGIVVDTSFTVGQKM